MSISYSDRVLVNNGLETYGNAIKVKKGVAMALIWAVCAVLPLVDLIVLGAAKKAIKGDFYVRWGSQ